MAVFIFCQTYFGRFLLGEKYENLDYKIICPLKRATNKQKLTDIRK